MVFSYAVRTPEAVAPRLGSVRSVLTCALSNHAIAYARSADYYPFGLQIAQDFDYRYGYQGEYAEDETEETGFNSFQLRAYDPVLGRWFAPDPYGQYHSPYLGMGNNPVSNVDPDGGKAGKKTLFLVHRENIVVILKKAILAIF